MSAENETTLLLAYLGHSFVFASKKLGSFARILGGGFYVWYTVVDTFVLAREVLFFDRVYFSFIFGQVWEFLICASFFFIT